MNRALKRLKDVEDRTGEARYADAIHAAVLACQQQLEGFLETISKYETSLGAWGAQERRIRGFGRKMEWALARDEDVKKLRSSLEGHMRSINTLLLTQILYVILSIMIGYIGRNCRTELILIFRDSVSAANSKQITLSRGLEDSIETQRQHFQVSQEKILNTEIVLNYHHTALTDLRDRIASSIDSQMERDAMLKEQKDMLNKIYQHHKGLKRLTIDHPTSKAAAGTSEDSNLSISSRKILYGLLMWISSGARTCSSVVYLFFLCSKLMQYLQANPISRHQRIDQVKGSHDKLNSGVSTGNKPTQQRTKALCEREKPNKLCLTPSGRTKDLYQNKLSKINGQNGSSIPLRHPHSINEGSKISAHIPTDISFLVSFESLKCNYGFQERRSNNSFWYPNDRQKSYITGPNSSLFLWKGGTMKLAGPKSADTTMEYSTASVFTQYPDTDHLLATDFDVRKRDVYPSGWKTLSFEHEPAPAGGTYSKVTIGGSEEFTAAEANYSQILPRFYWDHGFSKIPYKKSAGLVGNLPLLLSLAAFTAPLEALSQVLTASLAPGKWIRHQYPASGCKFL